MPQFKFKIFTWVIAESIEQSVIPDIDTVTGITDQYHLINFMRNYSLLSQFIIEVYIVVL